MLFLICIISLILPWISEIFNNNKSKNNSKNNNDN